MNRSWTRECRCVGTPLQGWTRITPVCDDASSCITPFLQPGRISSNAMFRMSSTVMTRFWPMEYPLWRALIRLDARLLDDLRPHRNLRLDGRSELIRGVGDDFHAKVGKFSAQLRVLERLDSLEMEPADDCRGSARRREESIPQCHFETRIAGLGDGRHLWERRRTLQRGHGERAQPSFVNQWQDTLYGTEHHRDTPAKQIRDRRSHTFVRDVSDVDARHGLQQFRGQVGPATAATGSEREPARLRPSQG